MKSNAISKKQARLTHFVRKITPSGTCVLTLASLAVVFWIYLPSYHPLGVSPHRAALIAALGPIRPLEGRLAGGIKYTEMETDVKVLNGTVIGYIRPSRISSHQGRNAAPIIRRIQQAYRRIPTPQTMGDQAFLILLRHGPEREHLEKALPLLHEAVAKEPKNAYLWNDLAAAYLASTRPDPPGGFLALSAAHRALRENPSLSEARFNLALALEQCSMFFQARRAWEEYLRHDSRSGWAEEARLHLKELQRPYPRERWTRIWKNKIRSGNSVSYIPISLHQLARKDAMDEILGKWGVLHSAGRADQAAQELETARRIGDLISDKTIHDAIVIIQTAGDQELKILREGHRAYQNGLRWYRASRLDLARPELEVAARLFNHSGSPFEYWANAILAEIACHQMNLSLAENIIAGTRAKANFTRYQTLNNFLFLTEGLLNLKRSNFEASREAFHSAEFPIGEQSLFQYAGRIYRAEASEAIGNSSWVPRNVAIRTIRKFPESPYFVFFFRNLAHQFQENHPEVALYLLNEGMESARMQADPSLEVEVLIDQIRMWSKLNDEQSVLKKFSYLQTRLLALGDVIHRHRLQIDKDVLYCQIFPRASPNLCVTALTNAIAHYERQDRRNLLELYQLRAEFHRKLKKLSNREEDLLKSIEVYEEFYGDLTPTASFRQTKGSPLFDNMVSIQLTRQDFRKALEFEERSKAFPLLPPSQVTNWPPRGWPTSMSGNNLRPYSRLDFIRALPKWTTLIEYEVSGDRLSAWVFRENRVKHVRLKATRQQIVELLPPPTLPDSLDPRLRSMKNLRVIYPRTSSPELSEALLMPLKSWLPTEGDFIFITGPLFDSIDFANLAHPQTQQQLSKGNGIGNISKGDDFSLSGDLTQALKFARHFLARDHHQARKEFIKLPHSSPDSISHSLSRNTALIEYSIIKNRLLIWIMTAEKFKFESLPIDPTFLRNLKNQLHGKIHSSRSNEILDTPEQLYTSLIQPIAHHLPRSGDLIIVPDEFLTQVPFAALKNPSTGKYLLDDYSVSIIPSASLYLTQLNRQPRANHKDWTIFAVSNPLSPEQPDRRGLLPGAALEVDNIVNLYPGSEKISGLDAHIYRAYPSVNNHEIVHFAGHWNPNHKTYDETLEPGSFSGIKTRLVVLSACNTASTTTLRREEGFGLTAPLLAQGIPAVIASVWEIDDLAANQLLIRFYKHFRDGKDGANALRAAQLELLYGQDATLRDPAQWAGFQLFGFGGV